MREQLNKLSSLQEYEHDQRLQHQTQLTQPANTQMSGTASGLVAGMEPLAAAGAGAVRENLPNNNSRGTNLTGLSGPDTRLLKKLGEA